MKLELKFISDAVLSCKDVELPSEPSLVKIKKGQTVLSSSPDVIYGSRLIGNWTIEEMDSEYSCTDCNNIIYGIVWICDSKQCELPEVTKAYFYSDSDLFLGEVIQSFNPDTFYCSSKKCKSPGSHTLLYCCYRGAISVNLQKIDEDFGSSVFLS